jgi:hypothetical protein
MFSPHYIDIDSPFHSTWVCNYGEFLLSFPLSRKIKFKLYAFIIVPFVVCRREKLELSRFGEEYKPSVFHNGTLRKTFEPKRM